MRANYEQDIDIITERPPGASASTPPPQPSTKPDRSIPIKHERAHSSTDSPISSKRQKTTHTPSQAQGPSRPPPPSEQTPQRPGTDYPEVRTSTISLDAEPVYDDTGKPISGVDIDADLAQHNKPWRLPGADQSDYFNYGFDEYTWVQYCIRQGKMQSEIKLIGEEKANFDKMFGGGMGTGMDASGGMNPDMMQQMMQAMMGQTAGAGVGEGMGGYENMMAPTGPMGGGGGGGGGGMNGYGGQPGMDGGVGGGHQNFRGRGRGRRY